MMSPVCNKETPFNLFHIKAFIFQVTQFLVDILFDLLNVFCAAIFKRCELFMNEKMNPYSQ